MSGNKVASSRTWGRQEQKSNDQIWALYLEFLKLLKVPQSWKLIGNVHVISDEGVAYSFGQLYEDKATSGMNFKKYRVFWNVYSEHAGIVRLDKVDFGTEKKTCIISNKTVEQLNEYMATQLAVDKVDVVDEESSEKMDNLRQLIEGL